MGAVLKGVLNPSKAEAARDDLVRAFAALGYNAPTLLVSQGSVALSLMLAEMKAQRPDRSVVVVPAYCCPSVPNTVKSLGLPLRAAPVRADLNMDLDALAPLLGRDVLAVVGVHMYALPLDVSRLRAMAHAAGAFVVDDAAHVVGFEPGKQRLGTMGDAGLLSFHQSKTLTGGSPNGGGALILTNGELRAGIERRFAALPEGRSRLGYYVWFALRYALEITPRAITEYNDPLDDALRYLCGIGKHVPERMSAAASYAVAAQLLRLRKITEGRRTIVARYLELLKGTPGIELVQTAEPQSLSRVVARWHGPASADVIREKLMRRKITTRLPYPIWTDEDDPTAPAIREIVRTHLELPAGLSLRREDLAEVTDALAKLLAGAPR
jgi:dTDP-4-amino-4,6-dideoxygalactose transaminase